MAIAKAQCTCSTCNQKFEYRKNCANRRAADSFESWAQENITECPDCRAARIQSQRDQENAQAAQIAADHQRPALKGSEKQIAWATTIREKCLASVTSYYAAKMSKHPEAAIYQDVLTAYLLNKRAAAWWIEKMRSACENLSRILAVLNAEEPEEYKALCAEVTAKIAEAKKAASPSAQESASTQQAPRLEGSQDQVRQAQEIRSAALAAVREQLKPNGSPHDPDTVYSAGLCRILLAHRDAAWWLRNFSPASDSVALYAAVHLALNRSDRDVLSSLEDQVDALSRELADAQHTAAKIQPTPYEISAAYIDATLEEKENEHNA